MAKLLRVTTRNATFQHWQALLTNRTLRHRSGEFVVQGVRPVTIAVQQGWPVRQVLHDADRHLSGWARDLLAGVDAPRYAVAAPLLRELGGKDDETPELLLVVAMPPDDPGRIDVGPGFVGAVFDRPTGPGNIGTLVRSVDAFGGTGVIVSGHAADPYDPKAVRATTGSLFTVPVVRTGSGRDVLAWVQRLREAGTALTLVGTDEHGDVDLADHDLTGPSLVLVGNETAGLSTAWRQACDVMVRIPMSAASASSLNAAGAATVVLYEAARQRAAARRTLHD